MNGRKRNQPRQGDPADAGDAADEEVVARLDEALSQAGDNLSKLDGCCEELAEGLQLQAQKEKTRLLNEIDEVTNQACSLLQKRKHALVTELAGLDQYFLTSHPDLQRVESKRNALKTAIQKARYVMHSPALQNYCCIDEVLDTLRAPVNVLSSDMSSLSLGSDLRCSLQREELMQCLKISKGDAKCVCSSPECRCVSTSGSQVERRGKDASHTTLSSPQLLKKSLELLSVESLSRPNVIIEEIVEESDSPNMSVQNQNLLLDNPGNRLRNSSQFLVVVTHIVNPSHFYVRYVREQKCVANLAQKINSICSEDRSLFKPHNIIKTGMTLFVLWKPGVWARALAHKLFQKGQLESVSQCSATEIASLKVFLQDYGFTENLVVSDGGICNLNKFLRRADLASQSEMSRFCPMAIRCSLKDIVPVEVSGWSSGSCEEFHRVVGSAAVQMQVFGEESETLLVDLKKSPMDQGCSVVPISLREHLVFMELARFFTPLVSVSTKPPRFYPPIHPKSNVEVVAVISHVNTPHDFCIQLEDDTEFLLLTAKLQEFYGASEAHLLQLYCPVLEQACAALNDDNVWYRAVITGFPGGRMVEVQFVDFGNRKVLSISDLRQIKDPFFSLPAKALRCSLSDTECDGEGWSNESIERFCSLTEFKLVTVVSEKKCVSQSVPLPVRVYERDDKNVSCIAQILVSEGLAKRPQTSNFPVAPVVHDAVVWDPPLTELTAVPDAIAKTELVALEPDQILSANQKDLRVRVTHVTSPASIHVQLLQCDPQLKRLHERLKCEYSRSEVKTVAWASGTFCALYNNGVWERGTVCNVSANNLAEVLRCDFGNTIKLHVDNLRPLLPELVGSLLLECCLSGIRPAGGSGWTGTACDFIAGVLTGVNAVMSIQELSPACPACVCLVYLDQAGQEVSIADFLVSMGLALKERINRLNPELKVNEGLPVSEVKEAGSPREEKRHASTPPPKLQKQVYLPPELPHLGRTSLTVTAIGDNGVIYTMSSAAKHLFQSLKECLQQQMISLPSQKHYNWRSVQGCVVMGTDMLWYRGQVLDYFGGHVRVRYVDLGLVENIPVCHVYPVVLCEDVPQLCVPCRIGGVIPVAGQWHLDALALLHELLLGRCVDVQILELPVEPHERVVMEIFFDDMPLNTILVHHQHAAVGTATTNLEKYGPSPSASALDDLDLTVDGLFDPLPVLKVFSLTPLPYKGKRFPVRIKHVRTPNQVFLCSLGNREENASLEEAMTLVNQDIASLPHLTDFPFEGPCLAQYSDGSYYRAKLIGFAAVSPEVRVLVQHIDFGSDDVVSTHKLLRLPESLLHFRAEAVHVRLGGFKAPDEYAGGDCISYAPEWSMSALLMMIDLFHENLTAEVTASEPEPTVFLYNASGALVHLPLIENGLAYYA